MLANGASSTATTAGTRNDLSENTARIPLELDQVHPAVVAGGLPRPSRSRRLRQQLFRAEDTPRVLLFHSDMHVSSDLAYAEANRDSPSDLPELPAGQQQSQKITANQTISTLALAAMTFFGVSGGPIGIEALVSSGGPFNSFLVLIFIPLTWCLPMALVTAELATMLPVLGGYIVWVERAFGRFWAFQNGIWKCTCNVIDNALYPSLFLSYLMDLTGPLSYGARIGVSYSLIIFVCFCNVLGVDVVSDASSVFVFLTLAPFVLMVIVGLARGGVDPKDWGRGREDGLPIDVGVFITIALWKTSGFDNSGTCAAEVKNPARAFPRAMLIAVCLVTFTYILPIAVGVSYATDYKEWKDGYFVTVAKLVAGEDYLGIMVTVSGVITAVAMLNTTICTSSRAIQSMAALGFFPAPLAHINKRFKTPDVAVIVNGVIIMLVLLPDLDFSDVAQISMFFYALSVLMLFAAFIRLRMIAPNMVRPYRIPLRIPTLMLIVVLPPCAFCTILIVYSNTLSWVVCMSVVTSTIVLYLPCRWYAERRQRKRNQRIVDEAMMQLELSTHSAASSGASQAMSEEQVGEVFNHPPISPDSILGGGHPYRKPSIEGADGESALGASSPSSGRSGSAKGGRASTSTTTILV